MRARRFGLVAFLLLAVLWPAASRGQGGSPLLGRLDWLAGCWALERGGRVIHEQWMRPLAGSMLGMARTVAGGRTVSHEFLRIEERDSSLVYVALPSGQRMASFPHVELTDSLVVFSNPQHDFPQRIRYRRLADGSLLAQIEGEREGRTRVVEYPMRRVPCDGGR